MSDFIGPHAIIGSPVYQSISRAQVQLQCVAGVITQAPDYKGHDYSLDYKADLREGLQVRKFAGPKIRRSTHHLSFLVISKQIADQ